MIESVHEEVKYAWRIAEVITRRGKDGWKPFHIVPYDGAYYVLFTREIPDVK